MGAPAASSDASCGRSALTARRRSKRACCRRGSGRAALLFPLQRQVKPLVAAVLLRMPGGNPIQLNPELQPPHRQRRQPAGAQRRKRRPIVGPQRPRQPVRRNVRSNHGRTPDRAAGRSDSTAQAAPHRHRRRVAARAIRRAKPALEVRPPHIIRSLGRSQRLRQGHDVRAGAAADSTPRRSRSPSARAGQPLGGARLEHRPQFLGAPVGCVRRKAIAAAAPAAMARPCALGARDGSASPLALLRVPRHPLVKRLRRIPYRAASARLVHSSRSQSAMNATRWSIRRLLQGICQSHPPDARSCYRCIRSNLLPMYPVRTIRGASQAQGF